MRDPLEAGTVVAGRYRLDRLLGEGGMGTVWAATHVVTRKAVALKFLKPAYAARKEVRQRFLREARAACAVRHPNVVQIHDVLELEDGMPAMVMDLLHGESLGERLEREHALPLVEVARVMLPVVSAVGTAHSLGIVHRDLKPDNLFLVREPDESITVKVLDFGIAKLTATEGEAAETGALTKTGSVLGTPYYMSPEQAFGEKDLDHRSDVWAIGIILYECLTGERPTAGENLGQIFKAITTGGIVPLERVAPNLPADVSSLVTRMLSRDRAQRPDLREVRETLQKHSGAHAASFGPPAVVIITRGGGPDSRPVSSGQVVNQLLAGLVDSNANTTTRGTVAESAASQPVQTRRRNVPLIVAVGVIAIGGAAVGAWRIAARQATTAAAIAATQDAAAGAGVASSPTDPEPSAAPPSTASASATPSASISSKPLASARPGARMDAGQGVAPVTSAQKPATSAAGPAGLADKPPF